MDTICAISTAPGIGGIGIVRISGKSSIEILDKIFLSNKGKKQIDYKSHYLNYGYILDQKNGQRIDEVLVSVMRAPNTYTKEDVVEINCHGGNVSLRKILELCLKNGARLATAGEFTKRAFLNGRIDLAQAEAVIDLINSKTDLGFESAFEQLEGHLSQRVGKLKNEALSLIAHIEASIDFPEHDIEETTIRLLLEKINQLIEEIDDILKNADKGKLIREGLSTAIVGKPNVGKSSLLNSLVRENRAIVTEVPGTTRDIIEEYINVGGVPLKVIDTAGIRETEDVVEKIGVQRSNIAIEKANLILFVLDNNDELSESDLKIAEKIRDKKTIIIINKIDLENKLNEEKIIRILPDKPIIRVSVKEERYLDKLENTISEMFFDGHIELNNNVMITNIRHKSLLEGAKDDLIEAKRGLEESVPVDCVSIDIKNCLEKLGGITGDYVSEDIIDEIFKSFCIGK